MWGCATFSCPLAFHDRQIEPSPERCRSTPRGPCPLRALPPPERTGDLLLLLPLLEMNDGDPAALGELVDLSDVGIADFAERGGGGDVELPLPPQEDAHLSHRLE